MIILKIDDNTKVIQMDDTERLKTNSELTQELKNVRKLIKYLEGFSQTPNEYRNRIKNKIESLENKIQITELNQLYELKTELEKKIDLSSQQKNRMTYLDHLRGWYLRPLINHFDNTQKIRTLTDATEGANALKRKLQLFIPKPYYMPGIDKTKKHLRELFKFKAHGKGSSASFELEQQFYRLFEFTSLNPIFCSSFGALDLPVIHYNATTFCEHLNAGDDCILITGLCPLSTITNELGFKLPNDEEKRPILGFESLPVDFEEIIDISWPPRPIISDYIFIRNILELYKNLNSNSNVSVLIWYPYHEYYLDLTESIFDNYLANDKIQAEQLTSGMDVLKERYFKLIEFTKSELGLNKNKSEKNISIIEVDASHFRELEKYRTKVDLSFFKYIYGSWIGNERRRRLYEQLVIKHIKPVFDGVHVLHLDTSYELWVDILGSCVVEQNRLPGTYSWVNYPSVPSISLRRMREFNSPHDDKFYLAGDSQSFKNRLDKLTKEYIYRVAPLILNEKIVTDFKFDEILDEFKAKLLRLNEYLKD